MPLVDFVIFEYLLAGTAALVCDISPFLLNLGNSCLCVLWLLSCDMTLFPCSSCSGDLAPPLIKRLGSHLKGVVSRSVSKLNSYPPPPPLPHLLPFRNQEG